MNTLNRRHWLRITGAAALGLPLVGHAAPDLRAKARKNLKLGIFTGVSASLPLEALVLETDAPAIPPHWLYATAEQRAVGVAQGRNTPGELPRIAAVVAALRGMQPEALAQAAQQNTQDALPKLAALL